MNKVLSLWTCFVQNIKHKDKCAIEMWEPSTRNIFAKNFRKTKSFFCKWKSIKISKSFCNESYSIILVSFSKLRISTKICYAILYFLLKVLTAISTARYKLPQRLKAFSIVSIASILSETKNFAKKSTRLFYVKHNDSIPFFSYVNSVIGEILKNSDNKLSFDYFDLFVIDNDIEEIKRKYDLTLKSINQHIQDIFQKNHLSICKPSIYLINPQNKLFFFSHKHNYVDSTNRSIICFSDVIAKNVFVHEIIHHTIYSITGAWPSLILREGLAEAFHENSYYTEKIKLHSWFVFDYLFIDKKFADQSEKPLLYAGLFCRFLITELSFNTLLTMYCSSQNFICDLIQKMQLSYRKIECKFMIWLKNDFGLIFKKKMGVYWFKTALKDSLCLIKK